MAVLSFLETLELYGVDSYSQLRKKLQEHGEIPKWFTTGGTQLFFEKYSWNGETVKARYKMIAKTLAKHAPDKYPSWWNVDTYTAGKTWEEVFFDVLWDGYVSCSTPLLANSGLPERGSTVSCAGGYVGDNLFSRYDCVTEAGILTKHSHGTSYSVDDWAYKGKKLPRGGYGGGVMPVIRDLINCMDEVVQGSRRGSLSYAVSIEHPEFEEVLKYLFKRPESNNPAWLCKDEYIEKLVKDDPEAVALLAKAIAIKMQRGKGYFTKIDEMNRHLAQAFKDAGMTAKASNLCQEVLLGSDEKHTFSCVILNLNLDLYDEWKSRCSHLAFIAHVMQDCNVSDYIEFMETRMAQDKEDALAFRKILAFTKRFRAVGTGVLGFHTLLQKRRIVVGSLESFWLNEEIFKGMRDQTLAASKWLAREVGMPEGCAHLGIRNATTMMMPPTKSTAEIMAGASEGIGLDVAMVFVKQSAGGDIWRVNKVLLEIMKERGVYNEDVINDINKHKGSVQHVHWLTQHEKDVFRTAFEIDMIKHLDLCAQRQQYIDQQQSINLYFTSNDTPEYIMKVHKYALENAGILALYYIYSMRGSGDIKRHEECDNCQ
ncbi:ribonucleoside-diphosphate reductase [Acinetobacter phage Mithridates]|nr:ribonucleoside-diphosphate reductase [Acinetobacter phage Mithridates]